MQGKKIIGKKGSFDPVKLLIAAVAILVIGGAVGFGTLFANPITLILMTIIVVVIFAK